MDEALRVLFTQYGPYGFGVFLLVVVWKAVIEPQLRDARIDRQAHEAVSETLHETALVLRECVRDLKEVKDDLIKLKKAG